MSNSEALQGTLDSIRSAAQSERDKGTAFERLFRTYLTEDALWGEKFSDVWMWSDWPDRAGRGDAGIDLVAKDAETGELWAIQAKFYEPSYALQKGDIDSFFTESGKEPFSQRLIVSTTDHWSSKAEEALDGQQIPVTRLRLMDLADSTIDWSTYTADQTTPPKHFEPRNLKPHQKKALEDVVQGFAASDRGKLIMACGTGKTFTALRIAENLAKEGGRVLFLVPSISLLQQTLREWTNHSTVPLRSFAVCSDSKVGKKNEDISVHDLQYPATTNPSRLAEHAAETVPGKMTVVFSTYQSLPVVAEAQDLGLPAFDLIICDEAHRTTGVTLADDDESNFVRIHDENYVKGSNRLYMTATPRIYSDDTKSKADDAGAAVASMDDEALFGPEFHRLGFGSAVEQNLLSDYKVLVLAVDESYIASAFQQQLSDENHELKLDDAAKIVGCWNGLAKRRMLQTAPDGSLLEEPESIDDPAPMKRAVAFAKTIKDSKRLTELFSEIVAHYTASSDDVELLRCETEHVDGNFNVLDRNARLDWLKETTPENTCRILSNARCLSEGVDVPALDAVLFLNPRNSTVDVVQSVGRVMRKHPDKKYGYVILPIGIPAGMTPEEALADHQRYKVVWQVLQALRAHDDRFNAMINKIELNRAATDQIQIIGVGGGVDPETGGDSSPTAVQTVFAFPHLEDWRDAILAKLVQKVGDRRYWEDWARDIAQIAERHITRIEAILATPNTPVAAEFESFLTGLRGNLNDSITPDDAIEMLAQHLITKPVFDALFDDYSFASSNPVSRVMQKVLDALDEHALDKEAETLDKFYESVRMRASGIDNAEGKQRIIVELYDKFFRNAFPRMADKLGIVYTPIEVVDYVLHSVQAVLESEFGSDLSDEGVHVLDPFTGTGTFVTRLIDSGLIAPDALERKYRNEIHANEIVLLAYYIAAINIEATFHGVHGGKYEPFDGIVLVDTFQMYEEGDPDDRLVFPVNNERVEAQKRAPIRVVIGNPPYSSGQGDANEANQNVPYPTLDARISETYVHRSTSTTRTSVYDAYFRAFRWASDRIGDHGVVAFVTNGTWIDSRSADGFRASLTDEFSSIWVFNLRGNARTSGEARRKEKGNVFGEGSRTPVAITVLVRKQGHVGPARIHYQDIGDYLSREDKLSIIQEQGSVAEGSWDVIVPNSSNDWVNQRDGRYQAFLPLGDGKAKGRESETIFKFFTQGLFTGRDAWSLNFCKAEVEANMARMTQTYNDMLAERQRLGDAAERYIRADKRKISWVQNLIKDFERNKPAVFDPTEVVLSMYRPFTREWLYKQRQMIWSPYRTEEVFPVGQQNLAILMSGPAATNAFSLVAIDTLFTFDCMQKGYAYPLFFFPKSSGDLLFDERPRESAISQWAHGKFSNAYGRALADEEIFFYVFGVMASPDFHSRFGVELRKEAPRVPLVRNPDAYIAAGRSLAALQTGYETVEPWPLDGLPPDDASATSLRVEKMRFVKGADAHSRSAIAVNSHYTLSGIPEEAYRFTVNGKSAVEWLMDRYQVKTDRDSGIVNDPNLYSDDPRYIIDLVARMVRVSVESVAIIDSLPKLEIIE